MNKINRLGMIASIVLIGLGVVSFALDLIFGWKVNIGWPLAFIMLGAVFFILVGILSESWSWAAVLYIPGALLFSFGVIFLFNVLTNDWNAWAYAWLLGLAGLGAGLVLANREIRLHLWVTTAGTVLILVSITLFVLFGAITGGRFIQVMAPILLVLGGLSLRWLHLEQILPERFVQRFKSAEAPTEVKPDQSGLVEPLSLRELEVLNLIEEGLTNAEIAARLTLAPSTVKTHINNIYGKLGVQTRVLAIKQAKDLGLIAH